ncbi:S-layer homology domain-containing protein [Paenibacillus anaericanus]|uniref:S-layer homology domain-containing protein n=1 Tax=Paenibacillus anaericanus TaxID=170367 RepID=A0A3S1DWI9_9BACL|nr:S-layer homology domain-containing protein [Paenibacillus anaericanus]RUT46779.1 S-layer homology domain-containing protein [Paenibacillus anaericanus]
MSKRKMITFIAAIMVVTSVPGSIFAAEGENSSTESVQETVTEVNAPSIFTAFKDITNHWGKADIVNAATKGYVNGYVDGTFKPNQDVSRAEFIKMVVSAIGFALEQQQGSGPWYKPYIEAAFINDVIKGSEYGDYNVAMTRLEMARAAVRAAGLTATSDGEYMLIATKNGLIHGTGKGKLDIQATTTRAQSVVIIERILKVRAGEVLPVDEEAIKNAEDLANAKLDPWGRVIRTTNLPKNAQDFSYILAEIPNEMYEMPYDDSLAFSGIYSLKTSKTRLTDDYIKYDKLFIDKSVKKIEDYFDLILNIDYQTIDYSWANEVQALLSKDGTSDLARKNRLNKMKKYVDWVKKNKIVTKGSVKAEPSMLYEFGDIYMRSSFEFTIVSAPKAAFNWDDHLLEWSIFYDQTWNMSFIKNKVGVKFKGYTDISLRNDGYYRLWSDGVDISDHYKLL